MLTPEERQEIKQHAAEIMLLIDSCGTDKQIRKQFAGISTVILKACKRGD